MPTLRVRRVSRERETREREKGAHMSDENRRKYAAPIFEPLQEEIRGLEERTRHLTEKRDKPREEVLRLNNDLVFWMNEAEKHGCHTFPLENDRIRKGETKVKGEF